jgi:CBS domain-containing protein
MSNRQVAEIIRDRNPLMLPAETSVREACRCMRERRAGAVLVTDPNRHLIGIFTGRDAVARVLAEDRDPAATKLADVMTCNPDTMAPGRTAIDALRLMRDGGFRHLPVVEGEAVVGIVSRGDIGGFERARLDEETGLWERL